MPKMKEQMERCIGLICPHCGYFHDEPEQWFEEGDIVLFECWGCEGAIEAEKEIVIDVIVKKRFRYSTKKGQKEE